MPAKTKILYIITKSNFGGAQKYVYDLATSLPRDQFDIAVAFGGSGALRSKLAEEKIRTIQLSGLERDISLLKEIKVFVELMRLYRREKPDIIHLNSSKIGFLGSLTFRIYKLIARSKKLKAIFTVHGWAFNEDRRVLPKLAMRIFSWLTSLLCTDIIVLSRKEFSQTEQFPLLSKTKIHLIPNGIKPFTLLPRQQSLEALGLDGRHSYIGTIAELHKNKGLDILISAFSNIAKKSVHLVIIGDGEEKDGLGKLAEHSGVQDRIHFLGAIPDAARYLSVFDIFVLPSRKEGLPYALLEAGYASIPVVASNVGGIPEIIRDNSTGLLCRSQSGNSLLEKLTIYMTNDRLAKSHAANLQAHVTNNYLFPKTLRDTQKMYLD